MKHILPNDTINNVLKYLTTQPFSEVHLLIAEIQRMAVPYVEPAPKACGDKPDCSKPELAKPQSEKPVLPEVVDKKGG